MTTTNEIAMALERFRKLRFGMMIHWGLYSVPAGTWDGVETPWVSEWIMRKCKIPRQSYRQLAQRFRPDAFDADDWVQRARDAGMKYLVFTANHHDGFAMFHSRVSEYNIVDATPFGRDVLAELAESCRKHGLALGCYYSQDQDWYEAGGSGNHWDFPEHTQEGFAEYLETKVKGQLRELLTNYGELLQIWFDTPVAISSEQSRMLKEYVHSLQPHCLVSGRIGHDLGDYRSNGDNIVPEEILPGYWECMGTTNGSWGYKACDRMWKSTPEILHNMMKVFAAGSNYLLNIGPDAEGRFPEAACSILQELGGWVRGNAAALAAEPFAFDDGMAPEFGRIRIDGDRVYLWVERLPADREIRLYGVRNRITEVSRNGVPLEYTQDHRSEIDYHKLAVRLPECALPTVLTAATEGAAAVNAHSYDAGDFGITGISG